MHCLPSRRWQTPNARRRSGTPAGVRVAQRRVIEAVLKKGTPLPPFSHSATDGPEFRVNRVPRKSRRPSRARVTTERAAHLPSAVFVASLGWWYVLFERLNAKWSPVTDSSYCPLCSPC